MGLGCDTEQARYWLDLGFFFFFFYNGVTAQVRALSPSIIFLHPSLPIDLRATVPKSSLGFFELFWFSDVQDWTANCVSDKNMFCWLLRSFLVSLLSHHFFSYRTIQMFKFLNFFKPIEFPIELCWVGLLS